MNFNNSHSPKMTISSDELSFEKYVERVAQGIVKYESEESLVMSIEGEWGSGKTTFINFLVEHIKDIREDEKFKYEFIHFNPWLITNTEQIVKLFFKELQKVILSNSVGAKVKEFKEDFKSFVSFFTPDDISIGIDSTKIKYNIAKKLASESKTLEELKNDINKYLSELNIKIIIVIDDIDRLTDKETEHIFRLVKGVADFYNLIYILSYDKSIVSQSIEKFKSENGQRYLEKIINYPLTIPKAHEVTIKKMLKSEFDSILKNLKNDQISLNEWSTSYEWDRLFQVILKYIKTIRDKNQLINIVSFEYPIIHEDTNIWDFIALSVIKLKVYPLYEYIKNNPNDFVVKKKNISKTISEKFHSNEDLLAYLFPNSSVSDAAGLKKNKIAHIDYFETYFSFSVSSDKLAYKEYAEIKDKLFSEDFEGYKNNFQKYETKYNYFLNRLERETSINENAFFNTIKSYDFNKMYLEQIEVLTIKNKGLSDKYLKNIHTNNNLKLPLEIQLALFNRLENNISEDMKNIMKKIIQKELESIVFDDFLNKKYNVSIIENIPSDISLTELANQWNNADIKLTSFQEELLNRWKNDPEIE